MKKRIHFRCLTGLLLWAGFSSPGLAQVIFSSNQITGTIAFSNADADVLNLLNAPSNEGMSNVFLYANSTSSDGRSTTSAYQSTSSRTSGSYEITVDSDAVGISYGISPVAIVGNGAQYYYFLNQTSGPVVTGISGPVVDFSECVGVLELHFVNGQGTPVPVTDGRAYVYRTIDYTYSAVLYSIPAGSTVQRIYLRGDEADRVDLTLYRGTNAALDRLTYALSTNVTVSCDTIQRLDIVVPDAGVLGTIQGTADVLGEFEWTVPGNDSLNYPDYTVVDANYGPFQNERVTSLPGDNTTQPSSGTFVLSNVVPTSLDPANPGYAITASMLFGTNRGIQYFRTPGLGWGSNAAVVVAPGATVNLSNIFEINPGFVQGKILFQGPPEISGHPSLFRSVSHAGDNDVNQDGIPDAAGTYGVYWSAVGLEGVNRAAPGASYTASYGYSYGDFNGDFNGGTSAFEGDYHLAVGGLKGERSIWRPSFTTLTLSPTNYPTEDDYFYNVYTIYDHRSHELDVAPAQTVTENISYCFSEVCLRISSKADEFYSPRVRFYNAAFTGTDFLGQPADYAINYGIGYGSPIYEWEATNHGQIVLYLPQGDYDLYPAVVPGGAVSGEVGLQVIHVSLGCGQRVCVEPCLQMNLSIPSCYNSPRVQLAGSVRSCTNNVTRIEYELNGAAPVSICADCGIDPTFAFVVSLDAGDNTLTVTAYDDQGGITSVSGTLRPDTLPPVIQCSPDISTDCTSTDGAAVNYTVTATDNCDTNVTLVCTPASGSVFPIGTTPVNCQATDAAGNSTACSFQVTVKPSALMIERAVIIRWGCIGTLQYADSPEGPWTDIPGASSPYCVPSSEAHRYYRTRQ